MATHAPTTGTLASTTILNAEAAKIATIMARFDRRKLETFLEAGVELLDAIDCDVEAEDATDAEDEGIVSEDFDGPGCPASDVDDRAYPEWHERGRHKEAFVTSWMAIASEDAEDDDGGGDCTEDEPGFDPTSWTIANILAGEGAGCGYSGDMAPNGDEGDYGGEVNGV